MNNKAFRNKISNYLFKMQVRQIKRKPQTMTFNDARTIAIIYEATQDKDYEIVKNYVKLIRDQKKEVTSLGYVDAKDLPYMRFSKLGLDFFTQKNITWYLKPNSAAVKTFMDSNFDILINLTIDNCLPLEYVAAVTKAKFKIGRFNNKNASFIDFMIKTEDKITLTQLIDIINRYLNIITGKRLEQV